MMIGIIIFSVFCIIVLMITNEQSKEVWPDILRWTTHIFLATFLFIMIAWIAYGKGQIDAAQGIYQSSAAKYYYESNN